MLWLPYAWVRTLTATISLTSLLLALPLALPAHAEVKNPNTFIYALSGGVDSLDPHWAFDSFSQEIRVQTYETLIFYKGSSIDEFEPMLSTLVPTVENGLISKDGLTYAFPIRKDVRFHDGGPLTPEDVKYSLTRFLLMDRAGGGSFLLLEPLLGLQSTMGDDGKPVPDLFRRADAAISVESWAVVLRLKKPYAPLLSVLAGICPIVSKSWMAANGGWDGTEKTWARFRDQPKQDAALYEKSNGTGPFRLERWDRQSGQVVLGRNEGYWRKPARLARLVYKTVLDASTRKLMLQAGDADAITVERQHLPQLMGSEGVAILDDEPLLEVHAAFIPTFRVDPAGNPFIGSGKLDGAGIPPDFFSDLDVRKGFAHAFDYEAYIRDGYHGKGERARGPIPKGVFGYNPRQALYTYDREKAASYFKKAFGGKVWAQGFEFTLAYQEGQANRQLACHIMKKSVEALNPNFKINVRGVQWSSLLDAAGSRRLPMINGRWVLDYPDPHNAVFPFLHADGYYAKTQGYSSPRADKLIEQAREQPDRDKRRAAYYDLQAMAYQDVPQIYTVDTYNVQALRSWVKGWYYHPIIFYGYLYPVFKEEP